MAILASKLRSKSVPVALGLLGVPLVAAGPSQLEVASAPTVMIVEFPRGVRFIGDRERCPGEPPERDEAEWICLAALFEGYAERRRHLAGPRLRYRLLLRLTAHQAHWSPGVRRLVAVRPFRDGEVEGYFAYWWRYPQANRDFCERVEVLERWRDGPVQRAFLAGYRRRFRPRGADEDESFYCIRG